MTTNVVFDFGAVLFTWKPELLVQAAFPAHVDTPEAGHALARAMFHHEDWQAFDGGTAELPDVIERTAVRMGLQHDALHGLMTTIPEHLLPIPDTVQLLERLVRRRAQQKDVRLYYLSNMPAPYARVLEQRHPFIEWFDGGLFSGDVKLIKPQPDIFRLLESRYTLDPGKTVFLDDLPANVEAARRHGWHAIHFESAAQAEPHLTGYLP